MNLEKCLNCLVDLLIYTKNDKQYSNENMRIRDVENLNCKKSLINI